jgi:nucleotide-binding universal stress UspA family protein
MKTFDVKHILIPVDFSETALLDLDHATYMAGLFGAELTILHVNEGTIYTTALSDVYPDIQAEKSIHNYGTAELAKLAKTVLDKTGLQCKVKLLEGNVAECIVSEARHIDCDVILMGTHGVSGFKEFFMGSNAYSVVSEASCPVISVQAHAQNLGFKNILLPIDDSLMSRQKVNLAVAMARKYGSAIHIAGLVSDDDPIAKGKFEIKIEQVENFLQGQEIPYTTKMLGIGDNIAETALQHAVQEKADLIIVMSEQDPDLTSFFMGPFSKQLVNHSKIPIMAVPPDQNLEQTYTFPYWT